MSDTSVERFLTGPTARRWAGPAVVALLVVAGWLDLVQHYDVDSGAALVASLLRAVPILTVRRWPLPGFSAVLAVCTGVAMWTTPVTRSEPWPWAVTSVGCILVALAIAGRELGRRWTLGLSGLYIVLTGTLINLSSRPGFWPAVFTAAGGAAVVIGGLEALRRNRETHQLLVEQEGISEAERTRRSLLEERARIGRELHDVVAHHMSLIAVQAETAPFRIPEQSDQTRAEFRAISASAREALTDMRKLLGLLRGDSAAAEKAPQPDLADIPKLVAGAPDATLTVSGSLDEVPPIVGVTAYRVVQESLSNARRHAAGAAVRVVVVRTAETVRLEIRNDRGDSGPAVPSSDGLGLVGMAERVGLLDGAFSAGPDADGGFTVTASLPLRG